MELTAVLKLLEAHPDRPLLIQAEFLVINIFTDLLNGWRENGIRKGRPLKNSDLIEQIDELLVGKDIEWERVKAHTGPLLNESADRLAGFARLQGNSDIDANSRSPDRVILIFKHRLRYSRTPTHAVIE